MLDNKDLEMLESVFDNRYRKVDDCNDIMGETDRREDSIEKTLVKVVTKFDILIAILSAIGVPILGICIKYLFGG